MMDMGFIDDIEFIFSCMVHSHQTLLFSATMPADIRKLAKKYLTDPTEIHLNKDQITPQSLIHSFTFAGYKGRVEKLKSYLAEKDPKQAIIFCNSRDKTDQLYRDLKSVFKADVDIIHGGMEQQKRTALFNRFRSGSLKIAVATDVAGRGLDFSHVSHVINFDFPPSLEAYTHRTGRTARMGREGTALTYFSNGNLRDLQKVIQKNNISPVWDGCREPDFNNMKKRKPKRNYRRKPNQGRKKN
jgi:ATP-dependent RNA helicase DeaD